MWKGFQKPKRLATELESLTDKFGKFSAQPFERGWGTTVGNSLRRALLSSIEGAAITAVKIEGVLHEFSQRGRIAARFVNARGPVAGRRPGKHADNVDPLQCRGKQPHGQWLPDETVEAVRDFRISIKGPLTTPVGGGIRSLNVALRQILDLYACVRPVRYFQGVASPVKHPERMDVVVYRENTEDVYIGIEWRSGTPEVKKLLEFLNKDMLGGGPKQIRADSAIAIKPISPFGTKRLMRRAIQYALDNKKRMIRCICPASATSESLLPPKKSHPALPQTARPVCTPDPPAESPATKDSSRIRERKAPRTVQIREFRSVPHAPLHEIAAAIQFVR